MASPTRFVPANAADFKRAAKDLQHTYPLTLQQSQELLARMYGYADLHELQQALLKGLPPGPYISELDWEDAMAFLRKASERFVKEIKALAGWPLYPVGHVTYEDLLLLDAPARRRNAMNFHRDVQVELSRMSAEPDKTKGPSDYMVFDVLEYDFPGFPKVKPQGVFALTYPGKVLNTAVHHLIESLDGPRTSDERERLLTQLGFVLDSHPNSPIAAARFLQLSCNALYEDWEEGLEIEAAREQWALAQQGRSLFEKIIPKDFKGRIEPRLVSGRYPHGVENDLYLDTLCWGAYCAESVGDMKKALAWARRYLRFSTRDYFGAGEIVDRLAPGTLA
jgi:hypothetical protein